MKVNNLDSALRVALIGTLILVMLCVVSFGLNPNRAQPQQDSAAVESGQFVNVPVQMQPVLMATPQAAPRESSVSAERLASLEKSIASLAGDTAKQDLSRRLERIESQITELNATRTAPPQTGPEIDRLAGVVNATHHQVGEMASAVNATQLQVGEMGSQLGGSIERVGSINQTGMQQLDDSLQRINQSMNGLSGTVGHLDQSVNSLDQSVTSLHDQQVILRQTVEQQSSRPMPQVNPHSDQIREDVASLLNGMHELKSEIAGLKTMPQPSTVMTSTQMTSPPVSNAVPTNLSPALDPPADNTSDEAAFLPLAPGSEEPGSEEPGQPEPEPFPATSSIPAPDFAEPEILPQSGTVPPTVPEIETIEPAALETSETAREPVPSLQPATLSPSFPQPAEKVPAPVIEFPEPALESAPASPASVSPEPAPIVGKIDLPEPGPISQMSFLPPVPQVADDSGATPSIPAVAEARYQFTATVMHVSAEDASVTAAPRLVRLEDTGGPAGDQASGHDALVQKLFRNAERHGTAEIVNSGRMTVMPGEPGRIAIGSLCLHCNRTDGVEAGDEIVLTLSDGQIHVEAMSPARGVRVESVPLMQFSPDERPVESTWLISEEAQEGSVGESTDVGDSRIEFVQRLVIITRTPVHADIPRLLPVPGVEDDNTLPIPAAEFPGIPAADEAFQPAGALAAEPEVYPAGYDRSNAAPRLMNPEVMRNAARVPRQISRVPVKPEFEATQPDAMSKPKKLSPLKVLRSVFDSHKSEKSSESESRTSTSRAGSFTRGRTRR